MASPSPVDAERGCTPDNEGADAKFQQQHLPERAIPLLLGQDPETKEFRHVSSFDGCDDKDSNAVITSEHAPKNQLPVDSFNGSELATDHKLDQLSASSDNNHTEIFIEEQGNDGGSSDSGIEVFFSASDDPKCKSTPSEEGREDSSLEAHNKLADSFASPLQSHDEIEAAVVTSPKIKSQDGTKDLFSTPPVANGAVRASNIFGATFPHGYDIIRTSAEGQRCGLEAVYESGRALLPPELALPTVEDLEELVKVNPLYKKQNALFATEEESMSNTNNFSVDQLALMLQVWGDLVGIDLQLGYITDEGLPQLVPVSHERTPSIIWVHNDDAEATLGCLGHWSGMKPKSEPKPKSKPRTTLHQKLLEVQELREANLWKKLLLDHQDVCPYSLLQETCPRSDCSLERVCDTFGETGQCLFEDCDNHHIRYSCVSSIENGFCDKPNDRHHLERYHHPCDGISLEDGELEQDLEWESREGNAGLRETHVMKRF